MLARVHTAGVAVAHGDHDIGGLYFVADISGLGSSREMSRPISAMACTTAALSWLTGWSLPK